MAGAGWDESVATTGEHSLTEGQVRDLIGNCPHLERAALFSLAVATGMRRSDIVRVRREDLDLDNLRVSYREKKKGDRIRSVTVPSRTVTVLRRWLNSSTSSSEFVFPAKYSSSKSGHVSGRTAYNWFQEELERNDLDQRPFHALRSTCVKLCQSKGWTVAETAKHIGDREDTIQKHYSTPSDEEMRQVAMEKELL